MALSEITVNTKRIRCGRATKSRELFNLQCWALTAESFFDPETWVWIFNQFGYQGDYEFIYFE